MYIDLKTGIEILMVGLAIVAHAFGLGKFVVNHVDKKNKETEGRMERYRSEQADINQKFSEQFKELKDTTVRREDFIRHSDLMEKRHEALSASIQASKDTTVSMVTNLGTTLNGRFDTLVAALSNKEGVKH